MTPSFHLRAWLGWLLLGGVASIAAAADDPPVVLPGESRATTLRLAEARKRIDEKKWAEALDELQGVLEAGGGDLVPLDAGRSVAARRLCHAAIAAMPPDALRLYRGRVDGRARKWLEQGTAGRDPRSLRKVVDEAFCSTPAEKALDLLGDLAFERGRFEEAIYWWRLLARLPAAKPAGPPEGALAYPDPRGDRARVCAKQVLARLFAGARSEAAEELKAFRAAFGAAEGTLAGRTGRYADTLDAVAREHEPEAPAKGSPMGEGQPDPDWATFGGDGSRGLVVPAPPDALESLAALCRDGPTWQYSLEARTDPPGPTPLPLGPKTTTALARTFAFHPIITSTHVVVADARFVTAHDLRTGASADWYDVARDNGGVNPNLTLPAPPDLRYTLTAAEGNVYVRLGVQGLLPPPAPVGRANGPAAPKVEAESFLACLGLPPPHPQPLSPEGRGEKEKAPLPRGERGWGEGANSHLRWRVRAISRDGAVLEGSPLADGGRLYVATTRFPTNRSVTSIDCYPADDPEEPPLRWRRDVCERRETQAAGEPRYRHHLLTRAGPLVVFCSHAGAIVAVDADTGQPAWAVRYPRSSPQEDESEPLTDLAPCLYAGGRLYAAPADARRLLCLDAATGQTLWEREKTAVVHLLGVGQGRLIFTTPTGLRAVAAADGSDKEGWQQPAVGEAVRPMGRGLLIGDLVLWPTEQGVYAVRQEDGQVAGDRTLLHRLPVGNLACAHGCLAVADRFTLSVFVPPGLRPRPKRGAVRAAPRSPEERLEALARTADDRRRAGEPARALAAWEAVLATPALRTLQVFDGSGRPAPAGDHAAAALHALPAAVRQDSEKRAEALWAKAVPERRGAAAERLAAEFPHTQAARRALAALAREREQAKQPGAAAHAWRLLLATGVDGKEQTEARAGLDRCYRQLLSRAVPSESTAPALPLRKVWHVSLSPGESVLPGADPGTDAALVFSADAAGKLIVRRLSTGEIAWHSRLSFVPSWAAVHGNLVLAGGAQGTACLREEDGGRVWEFPAPQAGPVSSAIAGSFRIVREPQRPEALEGFQLQAGRLFFFQGQRRLFALDVETGRVLWTRWAPNGSLNLPAPRGRFFACYRAGPSRILLQASAGRRWLLDAATGRLLDDAPASTRPWAAPPRLLDAHTLLLVDGNRRVLALDIQTGKERWHHDLAGWTTWSGEPPQVLARGDTLLLLSPTNAGYRFGPLDRDGGKTAWTHRFPVQLKRVDTASWALDDERVAFAHDHFLAVHSLADGRLVWERPLPEASSWTVRRVGDALLAYPETAPRRLFRFLSLGGSLQWEKDEPLDAPAGWPLLCFDFRSGELIQRMNFPAFPRAHRRPGTPGSLVVASSLAPASGVSPLRLGPRGGVVSLAGDVWGLEPEGK
jgi:outer membrane protein assembly factor BamB